MSISANFPTVATSLNLDFANSQQLDPRITFSRPTTAAYYDANTTALAEQNLLVQSNGFVGTGWSNNANATITANATTAPDGSTAGVNFLANAGTAITVRVQPSSYTVSANQTYTGSIYIKYNTNPFAVLVLSSGSNAFAWSTVTVNCQTGVITQASNGGSFSNISSSITSVGNSWYRVTLTVTTFYTDMYFTVYQQTTGTPIFSNYAGNSATFAGTEAVYLWGAQLEQRSSVTAYNATTTTAITNYIPVLLTAPTNQARFDHDPVARTSLGLLIEQQSTNLLTYSSDYTNAVWTKTGSSITATADVAPDGTQTASLLTETTATSAHVIQNTATISAGTYTFSVYAKQGFGSRYLAVYPQATSVASVVYNLTTGVATQTGGAGYLSNSITAVGNGWYRCSVTWSATGTTAYCALFLSNSSTNPAPSYTGDGFSGVLIWGAQLEALAFPTSYIPTVASQVTRSADSASMTGTNLTSWFNKQQGTFYTKASSSSGLLGFSVTSSFNSAYTLDFQFTTTTNLRAAIANVGYIDTGGFTVSQGAVIQAALSCSDTGYISSVNGAASQTSTAYLFTQYNWISLNIGSSGSGGSVFAPYNRVQKISYYPVALTATQLQSLTGS